MTMTTPKNFDHASPGFPPIREWSGIISRLAENLFRPQCIFYAFSGHGDVQLLIGLPPVAVTATAT
jgi:hypothetical protein